VDTATKIINALIRLQERADLIRHGDGEVPGGLTLAETHTVHWIGTQPDANVTWISARMGMTRGAISKIAKRLQAKGLVEAVRPPDNNKELHFLLTPAGTRVFQEHALCHAKAWDTKLALLAAYGPEEQRIILRFLTDVGALPAEAKHAAGHGQKEGTRS